MTQLERIDAGRNMARFYRLDVQPSFFGWSAVFEWGRLGRPGRAHVALFDTEAAAEAACQQRAAEKRRRGYT